MQTFCFLLSFCFFPNALNYYFILKKTKLRIIFLIQFFNINFAQIYFNIVFICQIQELYNIRRNPHNQASACFDQLFCVFHIIYETYLFYIYFIVKKDSFIYKLYMRFIKVSI